jgi:hypothetical protein
VVSGVLVKAEQPTAQKTAFADVPRLNPSLMAGFKPAITKHRSGKKCEVGHHHTDKCIIKVNN